MRVDKLPFAQALDRSIDENKKYSLLIVDLVRKMVRNETSIKQMEGPIGIARASGQAASQPGWTPLLSLMAGISLNLGIFNLLPIPILDGGMILMLLDRRPHSQRHQRPHQRADLPDGIRVPGAVRSGRDLQRHHESGTGIGAAAPVESSDSCHCGALKGAPFFVRTHGLPHPLAVGNTGTITNPRALSQETGTAVASLSREITAGRPAKN